MDFPWLHHSRHAATMIACESGRDEEIAALSLSDTAGARNQKRDFVLAGLKNALWQHCLIRACRLNLTDLRPIDERRGSKSDAIIAQHSHILRLWP